MDDRSERGAGERGRERSRNLMLQSLYHYYSVWQTRKSLTLSYWTQNETPSDLFQRPWVSLHMLAYFEYISIEAPGITTVVEK